jgi:Protein of unknown function (DUF1573)
MKTATRLIMMVVMVALVMGCRDRAAEKRIAELESRLAQIENKSAAPAANPSAITPAAVTPAPEEKPEGPLPVGVFETLDHDFGTVSEGQKVTFDYKFKNTGQAPLIIQTAQPSCGCTVPTWSKEPVPVGGTGFVRAEFDTNGKSGVQNKTITVTANTWPKVTTLRFKATVTPKPTGANGPVK